MSKGHSTTRAYLNVLRKNGFPVSHLSGQPASDSRERDMRYYRRSFVISAEDTVSQMFTSMLSLLWMHGLSTSACRFSSAEEARSLPSIDWGRSDCFSSAMKA